MKNVRFVQAIAQAAPRLAVTLLIGSLGAGIAFAQSTTTPPKEKVKDGYAIHQSWDLGGHIADYSGSNAVYDTMVNMQSGPRILNQMLEMHAVDGQKKRYPFFDNLFTSSTGYGGDPNNVSILRMSKGKAYDFQGMFRRDRQYFDYNLLGNPLVPANVTSNGYTFPQMLTTPHRFNTVRRMTDLNLTILPLSKVSFRAGYSHNIHQGPSYSSIHIGADALLYQGWRNSTDTWIGAVDWKPFRQTTLTYEQHVVHYKGDTVWNLTGTNLQLANGTPVTLGFDVVANPANVGANGCVGASRPVILNSTTNPPTANPCTNGYIAYTRTSATRTLFPTEEFRFQSAAIKNIQMNGRVLYTGANMNLPSYVESFNGLVSRVTTPAPTGATARCATTSGKAYLCERTTLQTGNAKAQRINVSADFGVVWKITEKLSLSDQYDFQNWRVPAFNNLTEVDGYGASMLAAPTVSLAGATVADNTFLGQKTSTNTVMAEFQLKPWASFSVGHRYRDRTINTGEDDPKYNEHQNSGLFGVALRPTNQWKINGDLDIGYSDNAFAQVSPRQWQQYKIRTAWKAKSWATLAGTFNDLERRDNVYLVGRLDHSRSFTASSVLTPSEHYGLDMSYGYLDVFSRNTICFGTTFVPTGATLLPTGVTCGNITSTSTPPGYYGNAYYDAPTQYGAIGIMLSPVKQFRSNFGYRMTAVDGHTEALNPRNVPGSLQSQFQSPYANLAWTIASGWTFKGDWNYYGYGEGSPVGPTSPRSFRGNVYTLGMHYEF